MVCCIHPFRSITHRRNATAYAGLTVVIKNEADAPSVLFRGVSVGVDGAAHEGEPMTTEQCEYWTRAQSSKGTLYMQVIIYSCQVFLNCSAFSNGKRLATLPHLTDRDIDSRYVHRRAANAERQFERRRAIELAMQRRQGNIVHAEVVEAVAPPVEVPLPTHPRLRPGEVQARPVFEVETTRNPVMAEPMLPGGEHGAAAGGGANGSPLMGTIVMGEAVYDDIEDPVCPTSSDQRR